MGTIQEESAVLLFKSNQQRREVQRLLMKIANRNCERVSEVIEGPRLDPRVPLTVAVQVAPLVDGKARVDASFAAVTKECSSMGLSLIVDHPIHHDELILGLNWQGEMTYVRGEYRHQAPLGAGFWVVGLKLVEVLDANDYPRLRELKI